MIYSIQTRNLSKRYRRRDPLALDDLNLRVPKGVLFGFIGPNGAGKTTTLRMLAGLLEPTDGEIYVADCPVHEDPWAVRNLIGYMPDFFGVYPEMTAWAYLDFFARCHDLPTARRRRVVDELLELVGLAEKRDEDVGHLSRGMQQRLCLAQTLVHDPEVLLLDEPASGLDPRARVEMRELLRELSKMGKTIVLSSHILSELADGPAGSAMCDVVGIIEHGKMVASGPLATLRQQAQPGCLLRLHILSNVDDATKLLSRYPDVADVIHLNGHSGDEGRLEVYLTADIHAAADLLTYLVQHGVKVAEFRQRTNELEELFLQLTRPEST